MPDNAGLIPKFGTWARRNPRRVRSPGSVCTGIPGGTAHHSHTTDGRSRVEAFEALAAPGDSLAGPLRRATRSRVRCAGRLARRSAAPGDSFTGPRREAIDDTQRPVDTSAALKRAGQRSSTQPEGPVYAQR